MGHHKHRVDETKKRSLLKAITGRAIEITVGTLIFGTIIMFVFPDISNPYLAGLGLNLVEEGLCFLITFLTERVWNKISWGRNVEDMEE